MKITIFVLLISMPSKFRCVFVCVCLCVPQYEVRSLLRCAIRKEISLQLGEWCVDTHAHTRTHTYTDWFDAGKQIDERVEGAARTSHAYVRPCVVCASVCVS